MGSRRTVDVGRAPLFGEKCDLISGGGRFRGGFAGRRFNYFGFAMSVLAIGCGFFTASFYVLAGGHGMLRALMCGVGFSLGEIGHVPLPHLLCFPLARL